MTPEPTISPVKLTTRSRRGGVRISVVAEGELEAMDDGVTADFLNIRSAEEPLATRQPARAPRTG
jgi:hypothetical protein